MPGKYLSLLGASLAPLVATPASSASSASPAPSTSPAPPACPNPSGHN